MGVNGYTIFGFEIQQAAGSVMSHPTPPAQGKHHP